MSHEPKFWVALGLCVELVASGVALVWPASRKIGAVLLAAGLLGTFAIFFLWPESETASPEQPAVAVRQGDQTTNSPNFVSSNNNTVNNYGIGPQNLLSLEFSPDLVATLPITIPPHQSVYVLGLHPKIMGDLQHQENGGDEPELFPRDWPKTKAEFLKDKKFRTEMAMVARCQFTNPNNETLLRIDMIFDVYFHEERLNKGGGTTDGPLVDKHKFPIEIPD